MTIPGLEKTARPSKNSSKARRMRSKRKRRSSGGRGHARVRFSCRRPPAAEQVESRQQEGLPWDELLGLIEKRYRGRGAGGMPSEDVSDELLEELVASLPALADAKPMELPEDREFLQAGGAERRVWRRRWGNPTE